MIRTRNLGTRAWAAAAAWTFDLDGLPRQHGEKTYRVLGLLVRANLTINPDADTDAYWYDILQHFISLIWQQPGHMYYSVSGLAAHYFVQLLKGREYSIPEVAAVGTGSTSVTRTIYILLPLTDWESVDPEDTAVTVDEARKSELQINTGAALLATGGPSIASGTIKVTALLTLSPNAEVTPLPEVMETDVDQSGDDLPPGDYSHVAIIDGDGEGFTSGDITALSVAAGAERIHSAIAPDDLMGAYMLDQHGWRHLNDADSPSYEDSEADQSIIPLCWTPRGNMRHTRYISTEGARMSIESIGNKATLSVIYRRVKGLSASEVTERISSMGATDPTAVVGRAKTHSKKVLPQGKLGVGSTRQIPFKLTGAKSRSAMGQLAGRFVRA